MAWYDDFEYELPKDIFDIKTLIENKKELMKRREEVSKRLLNGRRFLEKDDISNEELKRANELLIVITNEIIEIDDLIGSIHDQLYMSIENVNFDTSIRMKRQCENSLGDKVEDDSIDSVTLNINDLCMLRTAKEMFGIAPNNIEFKSK